MNTNANTNENTKYYAEGSVYSIDEKNQVKKNSINIYAPNRRKLNINIDIDGEKMFVRNADIKDVVAAPKKLLSRLMPRRSNSPALLKNLEEALSLSTPTPTPVKETPLQKTKKNKPTKTTLKRRRVLKKSPKKRVVVKDKDMVIEPQPTKSKPKPKKKQKSKKVTRKHTKTRRIRARPQKKHHTKSSPRNTPSAIQSIVSSFVSPNIL